MSKENPDREGASKADTLFRQAMEFMAAGKVSEAARSCKAVLAVDAGHAGALMGLAQLALNNGDRAGAALYLKRTIETNPGMQCGWQ